MNEAEQAYLAYWIPRCNGNFPLFTEKILGMKLNAGQARIEEIRDSEKDIWYVVNIILTGNRFGKTVYLAMKHLYKCFYKECGPGIEIPDEIWSVLEYVTINTAPSSENTKVMMEMILSIGRGEFPIRWPDGRYAVNDCKIKYFVDMPGLNNYHKIPAQGPYEIRYANKAKSKFYTMGLTHGDAVQGRYCMYATYDEFGRSKSPEEEVDDIRPRLIQYKGELDIITTPDMENEEAVAYLLDKREYALDPETNWRLMTGSTLENEYIPTEEIEASLSGMSEEKKAQIIRGDISLVGATYFDINNVRNMFKEHLGERVYEVNQVHSWGMDTSGSGKDYWALTDVELAKAEDKPKWRINTWYYDNKHQPDFNESVTMNMLDKCRSVVGQNNMTLTMDKTSEAGSIFYNDFLDYQPRGYRFGTAKGSGKSTKADLLDTLRRAINEGFIECPENKHLKNALLTYKGPNDDKGQVTDAVMSLALAVYHPYKEYLMSMVETIHDVD